MKRKVETHDVEPSVGTIVYVTLIKIDPYVHVLGTRLGFDERRGFWVAHVYVDPTPVPFLKIPAKPTTDIENVLSLLSHGLYECPLGLVVVLANLFHTS